MNIKHIKAIIKPIAADETTTKVKYCLATLFFCSPILFATKALPPEASILDIANKRGLKDVYIHIIFDGRSTDPGSAPALLRELGQILENKGIGLIVSGVGRGVALDRDLNWAKIQTAYDSLVSGTGIAYTE